MLVYQLEGTPGRPVSLRPRPTMLAGREELLASLEARFNDGADGPQVVALYGLGGVGKTSLAMEYAHRYQAAARIVWLFPAEDSTVLAAQFTRLATLLGVAGGLLDPRDPVAAVHAVLADSPAPWLLVFDNAPDAESIRDYLPPAGDGRVLITSQNALWPPGTGLEVPVLGLDVAAAFLTARTGDPDRDSAREVAEELGGLPLALEQAGAFIETTGSTLAQYLGLFRERRSELLTRGEPTGYPKTVATTWTMAFSRLEREEPSAVGLLRLLACYASDPVPADLLLASGEVVNTLSSDVANELLPLLGDQMGVRNAVVALRHFSLVSFAAGGMVLVHRLVQDVTLDQMPGDLAASWRRAAAAMIEIATPQDTELPDAWLLCAVLLPHAQAVLSEDSSGMGRLANYLGASGHAATARDLWTRITAARELVLGPEHAETLVARGSLARWTGEAGEATTARDLFAALIPYLERILGPDHPATLDARADRGYWTGRAGDFVDAIDQFTALIPILERVSGPSYLATIDARINLANWTGFAGDPAAARDLYDAILPVEESVRGPEHPKTLADRHDLGYWTGRAGNPAAARDLHAAQLLVDERVLGPEHPETLTTRHDLAYWTGQAGDPAAARDLLAALLPVYERASGPEHPYTLAVRGNLARWTGDAGNPDAARDLFAALVPDLERVCGAKHPMTLTARGNLARWTGEAGDPAAARDLFAEMLPDYGLVLGLENPETLSARGNLARFTGEAGNPAAARDQYAALLPIREKVSGPEHPATITARAGLDRWTRKAAPSG